MRNLAPLVLAFIAISGCGGAQGNAQFPQEAGHVSSSKPQANGGAAGSIGAPPAFSAPLPGQRTRMTERDDDADGIADYRMFTTESFDAAGNLVSVTEEQDFEADGVIDARETTDFR